MNCPLGVVSGGVCVCRVQLHLGQPKVGEPRLAVLGQQHVEALEVAVQDALGVEEAEPCRRLQRDAHPLLPRKGVGLVMNEAVQGAVHELQHHAVGHAVRDNAEEWSDVREHQRGVEGSLLVEGGHHVGCEGGAPEDLDGHGHAEILALEHNPKPSRAKDLGRRWVEHQRLGRDVVGGLKKAVGSCRSGGCCDTEK